MTKHSEATPRPWQVGYLDRNEQRVISGPDFGIATCWHHSVRSIKKEMEANAALIVRAVNSHDALVEALTAMVDELVDYATINNLGDPEEKHTVKQARKAIRLAQGDGSDD